MTDDGLIRLRRARDKQYLRRVNSLAVRYCIAKAENSLRRQEDALLTFIADGTDVDPEGIRPRLVLVRAGSTEEKLFRYATLHWSIPVSAGYGRRMRFLVLDESNGKLIGLFGLGDPVYSIRNRDTYVGWNKETKATNLYHVMDAYVLGAVPPYSSLLCGKLVALLALSNEVRARFERQYRGTTSIIRGLSRMPWLVMLTTTSALGRSSVYNRIKLDGVTMWRSLGFTEGSGEFHFSNSIYERMRAFVEQGCSPTAKHASWGSGYRNKREVIKKCLPRIGLSTRLLYHGIRREIFAAPLGVHAVAFLRGEKHRPCFHNWPAAYLSERFRARWLLPRAERMPEYKSIRRDDYRIWK